MRCRIVGIALFCLGGNTATLQVQEFRLLDRTVQVHGFASQGNHSHRREQLADHDCHR